MRRSFKTSLAFNFDFYYKFGVRFWKIKSLDGEETQMTAALHMSLSRQFSTDFDGNFHDGNIMPITRIASVIVGWKHIFSISFMLGISLAALDSKPHSVDMTECWQLIVQREIESVKRNSRFSPNKTEYQVHT